MIDLDVIQEILAAYVAPRRTPPTTSRRASARSCSHGGRNEQCRNAESLFLTKRAVE